MVPDGNATLNMVTRALDKDTVRRRVTRSHRLGIVVIGRNEGKRLRACLVSLVAPEVPVVYVDSDSRDGSVETARRLGVEVVRLNMDMPFTAARARNAGFQRLRQLAPDVRYVQFVDGDCEVVPNWLRKAKSFLDTHPDVAAVCGRRRERYPERSVYNRLCDIEWDTPVGETRACGGDVMVRADVLRRVGGFRADLIAGEEPELCVRLRADGWKVWRLDAEMTLHDADMHRFGQWWERVRRAGYAFAEGAFLHGRTAECHWVRESCRAWLWGVLLPVTAVTLALFDARCLVLLLAYPLQVLRLAASSQAPARGRWQWALFIVIGRFPEGIAQVDFFLNRLTGTRRPLIEYK